jgi:hypothetical protein
MVDRFIVYGLVDPRTDAVAARFGVTQSCVSRALRGVT